MMSNTDTYGHCGCMGNVCLGLCSCGLMLMIVAVSCSCVSSSYTSPTGTVRVDFESTPNEHRVVTDLPPHIIEDTVTLIKLDRRTVSTMSKLCTRSVFALYSLCTGRNLE